LPRQPECDGRNWPGPERELLDLDNATLEIADTRVVVARGDAVEAA
jgi:hypothetical protein